jgi:methyl-accepting chemotaxis protein
MSDRTEKLDLRLVLRRVEEIARGAHATLEAADRLVISFSAIEGRMSALESRMTGLESHMTRLEGRIGGIVQSYNRIEQILADIVGRLPR